MKYNVTIINTWFTKCEAAYGGACYIYSGSEENSLLFEHCKFIYNKINNRNSGQIEDKTLFGGSSLFITAKNGNISYCEFIGNKGRSGSLKMYNKFDDERSAKQLDDISSSKMNSFSNSNCEFVQ